MAVGMSSRSDVPLLMGSGGGLEWRRSYREEQVQ